MFLDPGEGRDPLIRTLHIERKVPALAGAFFNFVARATLAAP